MYRKRGNPGVIVLTESLYRGGRPAEQKKKNIHQQNRFRIKKEEKTETNEAWSIPQMIQFIVIVNYRKPEIRL